MSLPHALDLAYRAMVLGQAHHLPTAHAVVQRAHTDDDCFIEQMRSELARCEGASQQCFVSKINAQFLRQAIATLEAKTNLEP